MVLINVRPCVIVTMEKVRKENTLNLPWFLHGPAYRGTAALAWACTKHMYNTHTEIHTQIHTHRYTHTDMHTQIHTQRDKYTHTQAHTERYTHRDTHTERHTYTHIANK